MSTSIVIDEYKTQDFISVDHGSNKISLTIFKGMPKINTDIVMNIQQTEQLINDLTKRVLLIKKEK